MLRANRTIMILLCVLSAGCDPRDPEPNGRKDMGQVCVGGIITDAGECIAVCDPELCVEWPTDGGLPINACVDNTCRLRCSGPDDCFETENCVSVLDDSDNAVSVCLPIPSSGRGMVSR